MRRKIDLKKNDADVLYSLDLEARRSFAEIGNEVSASKETSANRIQKLEKSGIISGYNALINFAKLGLTGFAVFAQFTCSDDKTRKQTLRKLKEETSIYWIALLGGKYDFLFAMHAPSLLAFNQKYNEIQKKIGNTFQSIDIAPRIEVNHFKRDYLKSRPKRKKAPYFGRNIDQITLDKLDTDILNLLALNARESLSSLSRKLNTPRSTVEYRLSNLEESEIIQAYYAQIHAEKFGHQIFQLLITTQIKGSDLRDRFYEFAYNNPNIIFFVHAIGRWDFELTCEVRDSLELQELLSKIRQTFPNELSDMQVVVTFDYYVKWAFTFDKTTLI